MSEVVFSELGLVNKPLFSSHFTITRAPSVLLVRNIISTLSMCITVFDWVSTFLPFFVTLFISLYFRHCSLNLDGCVYYVFVYHGFLNALQVSLNYVRTG